MANILKQATAMALALLLGAVLFMAYTAQNAIAHHEPANKFAAAGSDIDEVDDAEPVLQERMKVSSPFDLILSATAECSILTELTTGGGENPSLPGQSDTASAYGSVRMWIEIDGNRVPVSSNDLLENEDNDDENSDDDEDTNDVGEVTFCNRAYERTVTDRENLLDGQDTEHDFIRTRTANGFNWIALDVGREYDEAYNGNNIVDIELWADYDTSTVGEATADAFVGSRTLIAEPTNASVHEEVNRTDPTGGS